MEEEVYQPEPAREPVVRGASAPATKININTAGLNDLLKLPGIEENHARMIIAYRNTYGDFTMIDELIDVPGISPTLFGRIRGVITVNGSGSSGTTETAAPAPAPSLPKSAGKLNINTATEHELKSVSGLTVQNIKLILAYRASYGAFASLDDLLDVPSISPETLDTIRSQVTAQ
ncbi:MAG: helix-hairpin-helix domain-containing protein [Candidatus Lindowbacteria bacterium]|nr:helix-hairpin-helix domain-containing protein [Candidatus Lindowbacteria bacterium]